MFGKALEVIFKKIYRDWTQGNHQKSGRSSVKFALQPARQMILFACFALYAPLYSYKIHIGNIYFFITQLYY